MGPEQLRRIAELRQALIDGPCGRPEDRWWERAKCLGDDRFYGADTDLTRDERRDLVEVCAGCPVAMSCLIDEELSPRPSVCASVRAAMTSKEREQLRRDRRKRAKEADRASSPARANAA